MAGMRRLLGHLGATMLILAVCGAAGCNEGSTSKPAAGEASKPRAAGPSATGGVGTIRGVVSLKGEPPVMREIANQPCHAGATPLHEETVVADEKGRLANVVVFLREAPPPVAAVGTEAAVLDQVNCQYVPHVLAIRTGQTLRVKTSDPTVHNVHTMSAANPARNISMDGGAAPVDLKFDRPEEFTVRCDIHPWMNAKVHVFDHGQFAVTKPDGSFELTNVPAGQYTLVFRHELFGDLEEVVELKNGQALTHDATYEKPGK
jgi:plastocyanin